MEWQVVEITPGNSPAPVAGKWTAVSPDVKSFGIKDLNVAVTPATKLEATKDYALFVRTAATDKKIASKHTAVTLKHPAAALTMAKLDGKADVAEGITFKLAVRYDKSKGAVLTNTGEKVYEYAFGKSTDTDDKLKWSTLKAGTKDKKNPGSAVKPTVVKIPHKSFSETGTHFFLRVVGEKQKGNEVTLSGVSAKKEVELAEAKQTLKVQKTGATTSATGDSEFTITNDGDKEASLKIKKDKATTLKFKFKIENPVQTGDKAIPKVKVSDVKGVTVKAGKLDTNGVFEVIVDVKAFKETPSGTAKLTFNYESLKNEEFKIKITEKAS